MIRSQYGWEVKFERTIDSSSQYLPNISQYNVKKKSEYMSLCSFPFKPTHNVYLLSRTRHIQFMSLFKFTQFTYERYGYQHKAKPVNNS